MPQTTIDSLDPAIQTQLRWILSRLDAHDAEFKATQAKFDGVEKRLLELAEIDAQSREDRSQQRYRLEQVEAAHKKFEDQQKDALPLIKEIHDTTRLATELAQDLAEARKEQREGMEQMRISHREQIEGLRKDQKESGEQMRQSFEVQVKQMKKALKKVTKAQQGQAQRFMRMAALVLGIGVSLTVVAQFVAQHLVFH